MGDKYVVDEAQTWTFVQPQSLNRMYFACRVNGFRIVELLRLLIGKRKDFVTEKENVTNVIMHAPKVGKD